MDVADIHTLQLPLKGNGAFGSMAAEDQAVPAHGGRRQLWASMPEEFWLYTYKVQLCPRPSNHDWTRCPYAHNGERARRRDPRIYRYIASPCLQYRGQQPPSCRHGLRCRYAHGVYEMWLHPSRFRTQMCLSRTRCPRPICFFAHSAAELRGDEHIAAAELRGSVYIAVTGVTLPMVSSLPLSPPRIQKPPVYAPPASPPPAAVSRDQPFDDQDMANRLRLLSLYSAFEADTLFSSTATAAATVATAAPAAATEPTMVALLDGGGEGVKCGRCVEEEDSMLNDYQYPHIDLIIDLVS
jgi:hypothetical protein